MIHDPNRKPKHGTVNEYSYYGCRCRLCKDANNTYLRDYHKRTGSSRQQRRRINGCEDITEAECIALLKSQNNKCAICRKEIQWPSKYTHVDHDHETGKVRGILCRSCNLALGYLNDDPEMLRQGIAYLEKEQLEMSIEEIETLRRKLLS